jgi:type II secretory pathway component PulK
LSDKDPSFDYTDSEGNFWVDKDTPPVTGKKATEGGEVDIRIIDEDSRININYATPERLRNIFVYAGIPEDSIAEIIDSVLDWKDPDDEHHLLGAENDYYEGLPEPYKAKNGPFDLPEELSLVKGINPDYLKGYGEVKALLSLITTFGAGTININTVSKEVMELIGLDAYEIEAVLKQRTYESGGFKFVSPQFARRGLNTVSSSNLRIEVTATTGSKSPASKIVAVVNRQPGTRGYKIQTIYWRESAENIRG